jgi:hypothetical protein
MNMHEWKTLPQTRKDAWWVWTALQAKMRHVCAWLEDPTELYECSLPYLKPDDVIFLVQPRFEQLMVSYRTAGRDCLMNVVFDLDLLSVRFAIDDEIRGRELLIVCRREQSLLMDENGNLLNEDQAAEHMVRSLLTDGQSHVWNMRKIHFSHC